MTKFFEEQATAEISQKTREIAEKWGGDLEQAAELCGWNPDILLGRLDRGEISVRELAELLYHMNHRILFTTRPMCSADHQQAEEFAKS